MTTKTIPKPTAAKKQKISQNVPPVWERIRRRMQEIPAEELSQLPADGSQEHDHYLYGSPKKDNP